MGLSSSPLILLVSDGPSLLCKGVLFMTPWVSIYEGLIMFLSMSVKRQPTTLDPFFLILPSFVKLTGLEEPFLIPYVA